VDTIDRSISVAQMFQEMGAALSLTWVAGHSGGAKQLIGDTVQKPSLALIGHLNFVHPNRVQVLGRGEMDYLNSLDQSGLEQAIKNLYSAELAAVIIANDESIPEPMLQAARQSETPLFTSPQQSPQLMRVLSHYLTQTLAPSTFMHGVMLDVLSVGVMITGEAAIGKSELALELITRGHRLVADDMVDLHAVAPDTLEGHCPPMLQDFLEVRGLGVLNIRSLFGETAVRGKKNLKLIVHLEQFNQNNAAHTNRLEMQASTVEILGTRIPRVVIPVAAGRNLAVLVEVAARNHILRLRGINSTEQFIQRQQQNIIEP
jgi:HPr kinase/phosphorylase